MSDLDRDPERPAGAPVPPAAGPGAGGPKPEGAAVRTPAPPASRGAAAALPPAAVLAALAAGAAGAVAVFGPVGLGLVLCALVVGTAGRLGRGAPLDGWSRLWAALATGLAATAMLRDALWVTLPVLTAAVLLMSLAVAGGAGWATVAGGLSRVLARLVSGPLAVAAGAWRLLPTDSRLAPALRGAALAAVLVAVFGALFASGDAAFERIVATAIPEPDLDSLPVRIFWGLVALTLAGALASAGREHEAAAGSAGAPGAAGPRSAPGSPPGGAPPTRRLAPVEWGLALGALNLLFAAFVAVQAGVLFGKRDHVLETAGLTYAEYARAGFAQLAVAAALTLAVVAGALRWARAERGRERIVLRVMLGVLCGLTLVVLASAAHRLDLYQDAFGATRLRLAAAAAIVWLGALLALVLATTAAGRYGVLPRACVLASAVVMLGVVLVDPDRRIAERNVDRHTRDGRIDLDYVRGLSADAAPALARLPRHERDYTLADLRLRLRGGDGWAGWNLSRARAREVLRDAAAESGARP